MEDFAAQYAGVMIKDRVNPEDLESSIIKGSVRVEFI